MNSVHSLESAEDCSPAASCEERLSDPEQILLDIRQTNRPTDRQICILNLVVYFPGELVTKFIVFF